jgi:hypothetical protein
VRRNSKLAVEVDGRALLDDARILSVTAGKH